MKILDIYQNLIRIYQEDSQAVALIMFKRGKSGLQERQCRVTPGRGNSRESAAENIPPYFYGKGEKVR